MLMGFVFQPFLWIKKSLFYAKILEKWLKRVNFIVGKSGESVIFEQNRDYTRIVCFGAFRYVFRAKSPHFCTFYRLVNLLKISQICLKIPRTRVRTGSSPVIGTRKWGKIFGFYPIFLPLGKNWGKKIAIFCRF